MPIPQMPGAGMTSLQDVINYVMRLERELRFFMEGGLDSTNMFETGGWRVTPGQLASQDNKVGMSSAGTDPTSVRFWAGDLIGGSPNFEVTAAGILTAIAAVIKSASGYPRVELNGPNNTFTAYKASDTYVDINPNLSANVPGIEFWLGTVSALMYLFNPGTPELFISTPLGQANIEISSGLDLSLNPSGNLKVSGNIGYTGSINYVKNVVGGSPTFGTITVTKGLVTGVS